MEKLDVVVEMIRVLQLEGQAILSCAHRFGTEGDPQSLRRALQFLHQSLEKGGKIIVAGVGKSGKVGQKIAATLSSTGSLAIYLHPTEGLHGDLGLVRPEDAVIALSYTGNTEELIHLLPSLKKLGVPIIGISGNSRSRLAQHSDAWIDASVETEACPHNLAPTSSTTLALAIGDAIAVALMKMRSFDASAFAQNHPGGSLGKKLNLRVGDLMHRGESVPVLPPTAPIDQVLACSTEKKLGAVLVTQGTHLVGIITDGDIRRSLQKKEKFFELTAQDVMTRNPVVIQPESMAQTALELMENRSSQISVLPVVDHDGNWKGLLRLHDLVRAF